MSTSTPELAETGSHSIGPRLALAIVLVAVGGLVWLLLANLPGGRRY